MASAFASTAPYWVPALSALMVYRRIRRTFGVQPWRPVRSGIRLGILILVACMLIVLAVVQSQLALAMGIGALIGVGVGLLALKHTHVAVRDGRRVYTPNPWIGGALTVLLVGRLAWRWTHEGLAATQAAPSPLTLGLAAVLIVYSLVYLIGLMVQMRKLASAQASEPQAAADQTRL
ncbi:hypothetical protein [Lysobacter sp. Root690]|uniref:hypothetical protein n=1 Tax=Lysobacter sp. Root690 TaxID=1736588 RepID=UPI000700149B|nr:hypothetical protein [Lysobacter sp. Root690]KRB02345.1 hypothetical protein ASD86_22595 [Lysobacter sp. Root690]